MERLVVIATICVVVLMFVCSHKRYDIVALCALLFLGVVGILSPAELFSGFSHPAIITLASVLVISQALVQTGVIDRMVRFLMRKNPSAKRVLWKLMVLTAFLSGFMNNIGALALILPVAMRVAKEQKVSPSTMLMPISFSSLLGGMLTEIGTPPNLIVSAYLEQVKGQGFGFFTFTPAALGVVGVGLFFIFMAGSFLLPKHRTSENRFEPLASYLAEVEVSPSSPLVGAHLTDLQYVHKVNFQVLTILRDDEKIPAPHPREILRAGDILIVKGFPEELKELVEKTGVELRGTREELKAEDARLKSKDTALIQVVLKGDSPLVGRTAGEIRLRNRYSANLVAVSRRGITQITSLKDFRFRAGDLLLLQVPQVLLTDTYQKLSALPLATRDLPSIKVAPKWQGRTLLTLFTIAIICTTTGFLPVEISFATVAALCVFLGMISSRAFYQAIEWPSIILLGSLLPLGIAFAKTGGADAVAHLLQSLGDRLTTPWLMVLLMVLTMGLANLISTSATAVLMGPIALSLAEGLQLPVEPLLLAVAIASSSSFLTPIGHQTNLLIMAPGGYRFGDYWPLGLPVSLLVIAVAVPLLQWIWVFS